VAFPRTLNHHDCTYFNTQDATNARLIPGMSFYEINDHLNSGKREQNILHHFSCNSISSNLCTAAVGPFTNTLPPAPVSSPYTIQWPHCNCYWYFICRRKRSLFQISYWTHKENIINKYFSSSGTLRIGPRSFISHTETGRTNLLFIYFRKTSLKLYNGFPARMNTSR
jgi:hypothetical protein